MMQQGQQMHEAGMAQMQADQQPEEEPQPAVGGDMVFNDKHVASAADIIKAL